MHEAGAELCKALELRGRKKSHRLTVAADLRNHIEPFFEGKDLAKITPQEIERYIVVKRKTLAIKTVRNHLNTIHSVFELGLRRKWCQSNPVKLAERPVIRTTETRIKFLDQPELEKLLAVTYPKDAFGDIERDPVPDGGDDRPAPGRAARTALARRRRHRAQSARRLALRARRVRRPQVRGLGTLGPARRPRREGAAEAARPLGLRTPTRISSSAIPSRATRWTARSSRGGSSRRSSDAEVREITFHELRHTFGTRMAAAGVPLRTIQHWMGHADAKTTQVYAHYQPSDHEADTVDQAFEVIRGPAAARPGRARAGSRG